MVNPNELLARLDRAINERYENVTAFCREIGLAPSVYFSFRSRRSSLPGLETFVRMCEALGLSSDELLGLKQFNPASDLTTEERDLVSALRKHQLSPEQFSQFMTIVNSVLTGFDLGAVVRYEKNSEKSGS